MNSKKLFSFNGRMRRKHYLVVYSIALALIVAISVLQHVTGTSLAFFTLALIAMSVPFSVRRLHDIGYSGWLVIGVIIVPLAYLLLLLAPGESGANAHGNDPKAPLVF